VVAGEAAAESAVPAEEVPSAGTAVDLGKRLLDYYDTFMAQEQLFLRSMCHGELSEHACEDVAQEAFMRVARKAAAAQLGPDVKIGAYLRTTS
jgi:RNA polymerase sigma-70 factor (ECF subfamily)